MKLSDYQRARDKIKYGGPVYNPVKEGLKKGFNFLKLFWALFLMALILVFLRFWGDHFGIKF